MLKRSAYAGGLLLISLGFGFVYQSGQVPATELASIDFMGNYSITDPAYKTKTTVTLKNGQRVMKTNGLPNHPTGDFPNSGNPNRISVQRLTYSIPVTPQLSGKAVWAREPGVALNGVKFEPGTAERFVCENGENYRIEALQELIDLGLDANHAHVQPTGAYHYHGVPVGLIEKLDQGKDLVLIGFAMDGFPIYYSKSGQYKPSYRISETPRTGDICTMQTPHTRMQKSFSNTQPDGTFVSDWEYEAGLGQLDECNGTTIDGNYCYLVTDEYPYVGRCLKGVFTEQNRPGGPNGPPGGHRHQGPPPGGHPHPHHH